MNPFRLENNVAFEVVETPGIKARGLQLPEAVSRNQQKETPRGAGRDLEAAVGSTDRGRNDFAVADKGHCGAADFGSRGICDDTAN